MIAGQICNIEFCKQNWFLTHLCYYIFVCKVTTSFVTVPRTSPEEVVQDISDEFDSFGYVSWRSEYDNFQWSQMNGNMSEFVSTIGPGSDWTSLCKLKLTLFKTNFFFYQNVFVISKFRTLIISATSREMTHALCPTHSNEIRSHRASSAVRSSSLMVAIEDTRSFVVLMIFLNHQVYAHSYDVISVRFLLLRPIIVFQ